jgi:hypothetical protein
MASSERIHVEVTVALVTDANHQVLLIYNDNWGMFTFPMTRRRRSLHGNEPLIQAALRAASQAIGVPVHIVEEDQRPKRLKAKLESGRQLTDKVYTYNVFHTEPHPDFAGRLQIRQPHLWLSPHVVLSGAYEPISESARLILCTVLADFEIPARVQRTSNLIIQRNHPERGLQFLMRRNPDWGFTLPAKRWQPPDSARLEEHPTLALAAAERVAREELGLAVGTDVTLSPATLPGLTTHGVSDTKGAPAYGAATDYMHSLFDATLHHPENLRSDRALAWVTPEEIQYRWTAASHGEPGAPQGPAGEISRTAYEVLAHLGLIAENEDPDIDELANDVIRRFAQRWLDEFGSGHG